jgi:hypothetical protein
MGQGNNVRLPSCQPKIWIEDGRIVYSTSGGQRCWFPRPYGQECPLSIQVVVSHGGSSLEIAG